MPIDPGPHRIEAVRPVLGPTGATTLLPVTPTFYEDLGKSFPDFGGHILVQQFDFDTRWPTWEMHPEGDEFVFLISGDVDFLLKIGDGEATRVRVHEPGTFVMVPKGVWHTADPNAPTSMLFVTPGEGTQNEVEPPG